jgi:hypothetical protein
MVAIYSRMGGWDFMRWQSNLERRLQDQWLGSNQLKGYAGSNPSPCFQHERLTAARAAHGGGSRWRHGRRRWLAGLVPRGRYGPPNPTRFVSMASRWDGDSVLLTFKRRWAVWRAGGGNLFRELLADGVGWLRWSSSSTKATDSFLLMPSCFPLWRIGSNRSGFLRTKGFMVCGTSINLGQNLSYSWCYL